MSDNKLQDNADYLKETKGLIRQALVEREVPVSDSDTFRSYADKIRAIPSKEDLDTELTAQENKIGEIKSVLDTLPTSGNNAKIVFPTSVTNTWNNTTLLSCIKDIDISNLNTSTWTYAMYLFAYLGIETIDISSLDFSKCTNFDYIFSSCKNLKRVIGIENINAPLLNYAQSIFSNCSSLEEIDLSGWNTPKVSNLSSIFTNCTNLKKVKMLKSNMSKGTPSFSGCSSLKEVVFQEGDKYYLLSNSFSGCSSLEELDFSMLDMNYSHQVGTGYTFYKCTKLKNIKFPSIVKVTGPMNYMFQDCTSLESIDLSSFVTSNVSSVERMFSGCSSLIEVDASTINLSNTTTVHSMFRDCPKLTKVKLGDGTTTTTLKTFNYMFENDTELLEVDFSGIVLNTSGFQLPSTFKGCTKLQKIDIRNFDFTKISTSTSGCEYMLTGVPTTCEIIVNQSGYNFFTAKFPTYTNLTVV